MNPIARMMKRYIKTPLKYALPLLFICALVFSATTGCTTTTTQDANAMNVTAVKAVQVPQHWGSGLYAGENPQAGNKLVGYNVTLKNVNAKDRGVGWNFWTLRDANGNVYSTVGRGMTNYTVFGSQHTGPGDIVRGTVMYEVPKNATLKSLTYNDGSTKIVTNL
jgi:hypothetical protein